MTFQRTDQGYKMRCPSCGAVVRLRARRKRRKPAVAKTELMVPAPYLPPPQPDEFDVELLSDAPARPRRHHGALVVVAIVAGVTLLAGAAGLALWLLG